MSLALHVYSRDARGVGIEWDAMGMKKRRLHKRKMHHPSAAEDTTIGWLKDARATTRMYRIAPGLE